MEARLADPQRTCVACRRMAPQSTLLRFRRRPEGVVLAPGGSGPGRAAYLHPDPACWEQAQRRRALDRALGAPPVPDLWNLLAEISGPL